MRRLLVLTLLFVGAYASIASASQIAVVAEGAEAVREFVSDEPRVEVELHGLAVRGAVVVGVVDCEKAFAGLSAAGACPAVVIKHLTSAFQVVSFLSCADDVSGAVNTVGAYHRAVARVSTAHTQTRGDSVVVEPRVSGSSFSAAVVTQRGPTGWVWTVAALNSVRTPDSEHRPRS